MLALARKYRPKNFATVAVQSHVSNTLKGAIARGRVAHGYLLCGPRGVGKTTLARVLAMALNCERKREDGEPCGECVSCTRIWSGGASMDVVEIDAASNRGVDDARDLRERAMYAPSGDDRYKVYIVDEAHMLTREAWNALLKILEEPPPRVVFVFATTEPQKIAQTAAPVLSRLQRFDFRRIGASDIRQRLSAVLKEENVSADDDALAMISRAADGSMRDALSLTDQVLALGDGAVTVERVREALGLVAEDEFLQVLDLIADRRAVDVFPTIARLVEAGVDLGQFVAGLGDMLRGQLAIVLGATQLDASDKTREALEARRNRLAAGDLVRMLSILTDVEPKFRRSSQQQLLLETLLIRFALLDRTVDVESMLREVGGGGGAGGSGRAGSLRPAASPASTRTGQSSDVPTSRGGYRSDVSDRRETPVATPRIPDGDARPTRSADVRASDARAAGVSSAEPRVGAAYAADSRSAGAPGGTVASAVAAPNVTGDVAVAERPSRPQPAPVPAAEPMPFAAPASRPGAVLAINTLVERWDEIVAAVRRERPIIGTLLEKTIPTGISASGLVTLQIEDIGGFEGLSSKTKEVTLALATQVSGISRVQLLPPESAAGGGPRRMTAESIKSESLLALRKRDPVLGAAIDELDLELLD